MELNVHKIIKKTKVEGPETRYCIWVQGCSRRCKGCMNTATWNKQSGHIFKTETLIKDILKQSNIEGVTFLGGEPFEQAEALGEIAKAVKEKGLGVLCFTGYYLEELQDNIKNQTLLENIDLLIDGPFEIENIDYSRPWCGSSNQHYHFLTNRYNEEIFVKYKNRVEVNISKNGVVSLNGMGNFKEIMQKMDLVCIK